MASPPPPAGEWRSIAIAPEGQVSDLISTPNGGLLAVGIAGLNGAVWLSDDGESWSAVSDLPPIGADIAKSLRGVMRHTNRYFAWGFQGGQGSEFYQSVIWRSVDGTQWDEVAVLQGFVIALVPGGPGFVAVGSRAGLDYLNGALAWSSSDGIVWTESPDVPGPDLAAMIDVAPFADGFVAVGAARNEQEPDQGVTWRSEDGISWEQFPLDPALVDRGLYDVVVAGAHLMATGSISVDPSSGLRRPAIWVSDDGSSWTESYSRDCCGEFTDIVDTGTALLAMFRWFVPADGSGGAALVRTVDMVTWEMIGTPQVDPGTIWQGLMSTEQGLLGLGFQDAGDGSYHPVLLIPPASL
jgi:hypothetical protein